MRDHPPWLRAGWAIHRLLDGLTGGRLDTSRGWKPTLWLTTVGRTSGTVRENALIFLEDGPNLVVVASNAGLDADPGWWLNLQAHPETTVRVRRSVHAVRAREARPGERAELWPRLVSLFPEYDAYARATSRSLPVVILEPRSGE